LDFDSCSSCIAFLEPDAEFAVLVLARSAEITTVTDRQLWIATLNISADLSDLLAQLTHTLATTRSSESPKVLCFCKCGADARLASICWATSPVHVVLASAKLA
jgi:hypothetical protein